MSNQTLEIYKQDIANWTAAIKAVNLPGLSQDASDRQQNPARCREDIVSTFPSVPLPCPILHENYYKLSLLALSERNELVLEKPAEPGYRMGQLFSEVEDETRELQPLPERPADPWQQSKIKEDRQRSAEESFRKYGRVLNPTELLQAERLEAFQSTAGKCDEGITVHKIINGRDYVDRTATAKARAEVRS